MKETKRLFEVGFKAQKEWGVYAVLAFFLGGVGAGLFLASVFFGLTAGLVVGLLIVIVGKNLANMLELGQPMKFLLALSRPGKSWISRGIIFDLAFMVFGVLYAAPFIGGLSGVLWAPESGLGTVLKVLALLSGFALIIYTGFLLSSSPAIPFWNTTLLPLLFVLFALLGGVALILIALPFGGQEALSSSQIQAVATALVAASLILVLVYLLTMFYSTLAAKESVLALLRGKLSLPFVGGVLIVGLVVPLIIVLYASTAGLSISAAAPALAIGGLLALIGSLLFFYSILKAGYYPPAI